MKIKIHREKNIEVLTILEMFHLSKNSLHQVQTH